MIVGDRNTVYAIVFQSGGLWHYNIHRVGERFAVFGNNFKDGKPTEQDAVNDAIERLKQYQPKKIKTPHELFADQYEAIEIRFDNFRRDETKRHEQRLKELEAARQQEIKQIKGTLRQTVAAILSRTVANLV
jgi:hypothetical protein